MPKLDLTRAQDIRLDVDGTPREVRAMRGDGWAWERPPKYLLAEAPADVLRDDNWRQINGVWTRTTLIEPGATNIADHSEPTLALLGTSAFASDTYPPKGFANAITLDNSEGHAYAYVNHPSLSAQAGASYCMSAFVEVLDGGGPPIVGVSPTTGDLCLVAQTSYISEGARVQHVWNNIYRVSAVRTIINNNNSRCGVIQYTGQSGRPFAFTGLQLEPGNAPTSYISTYGAAASRAIDVFSQTQAAGGSGPVTMYARWIHLEGGSTGTKRIRFGTSGTARIGVRQANANRYYCEVYNGGGGPVYGQYDTYTAFGSGAQLEVLIQADPTAGTIAWYLWVNGVQTTAQPAGTFGAFTTVRADQLDISEVGAVEAVELFSGNATPIETARTTRGDVSSYRPGDDVAGFTRASPAAYTARIL